jgi:hypothetical protein
MRTDEILMNMVQVIRKPVPYSDLILVGFHYR